ncbi:family 20 glycosylhydrolase [Caproiciproducens sp. MSJ-32]|uniref:family 20 glycosylhydrolase n=1 Tax=Caproiciproducens sp. MSJ-32 TaxID=2841527 RepID=UPI002ED00E33
MAGNSEEETEEISKIAEYFKGKIMPATGFDLPIIKLQEAPEGSIYLTTIGGTEDMGNEGYQIIISPENIKITAYKPEGLFRAIQTLRQMLPPDIEKDTLVSNIKWSIASSRIEDKPEYEYRDLMTDYEKTYEFIEDIIKELSAISPSKYIHIGGDEAEATPKEGYDYFVGRVAKIVQKYGKIPIGWDPIDTSPEIDSSVILQNWRDTNAAAREKRMKIIISIAGKSYLDMKYDENSSYGLDWAGLIPIETSYSWDLTDYAPKELILGIEAPLWTETIEDGIAMDYMIYPRLLSYAEIGWTPKEVRNWTEYKIRLEKQKERLANQQINYYNE